MVRIPPKLQDRNITMDSLHWRKGSKAVWVTYLLLIPSVILSVPLQSILQHGCTVQKKPLGFAFKGGVSQFLESTGRCFHLQSSFHTCAAALTICRHHPAEITHQPLFSLPALQHSPRAVGLCGFVANVPVYFPTGGWTLCAASRILLVSSLA